MKVFQSLCLLAAAILCSLHGVKGIDVDFSSAGSINAAAGSIAYDMLANWYTGNQTGGTPGLLPQPYFWWEAGAMFGTLIDYWHYTGDATYNNLTTEAILNQVGDKWDFMPAAQTLSMGNDDQGFWAMTAMTAAELSFPNPPPKQPQWLGLAEAVFNNFVIRNENATCGGGIRWQVFNFNAGYNYKNTIANGCFFNLGARLARYTGDDMYASWANFIWDWITSIGILENQLYDASLLAGFSTNGQGAGGYIAWDGADPSENCSKINEIPYTYNTAIFLHGAANMYSYTNGSDLWKGRVQALLNATINVYYHMDGVAFENACEGDMSCDNDQLSFKAYLSRWLAATTQLAPFTTDQITSVLATSAQAAAAQCNGGPNGRMCGYSWVRKDVWDGTTGVGQQMAAMEVIMANLMPLVQLEEPSNNSTNGSSHAAPGGGSGKGGPGVDGTGHPVFVPPTTADKVGASILTVVVVLCFFTMIVFMTFEAFENNRQVQKARQSWLMMRGVIRLDD